MEGSFDRNISKRVNSWGDTVEQAKEKVVEFAKNKIDENLNKVHARGKNQDNSWGIGIRGSGNYQDDSYMPYLEVRTSDSEPEMVELTNGYTVNQEQSRKIADYFFSKRKEMLGE